MADTKISNMTAASALSGTELIAGVQSGGNVKITANQIAALVDATALTIGTTPIVSGTTTRILYDNAGILGEYTITGTGTAVAMAASPSFTTPTLGVAAATSINKVALTAPATSATLTIADGKTLTANVSITLAGTDTKTLTVSNSGTLAGGDAFVLAIAAAKTLTVSNSLTLAGTDSTTMTFPSVSAAIPGLAVANTFTTTQTITPGTEVSPLVLTGGTLAGTTSRPLISATQTWNNSGLTATGILLNVTDTSSNAASLLMDMQVASSSKFNVAKTGAITVNAAAAGTLASFTGASGTCTLLMTSTGNGHAGFFQATDFDVRFGATSNSALLFTSNGTTRFTCTTGGSMVLNSAAIATNATDGFLYIATCAGTPTGTPTAQTGRVALVYDTSAHQFWIYDGGWKQPKTPAAAAIITWQ